MTKQRDTKLEYRWPDVGHAMEYIEGHYDATIQIHIETTGATPAGFMLLLTVVSRCGVHRDTYVTAGWNRRLTRDELSNMPALLEPGIFGILEEIDGGCPRCRAEMLSDPKQ